MRWAGVGSELWRVRVDLFALDDDRARIEPAFDSLRALLSEGDGVTREMVGVDQGTGAAERPVVGFSFWVRADDVGAAALTAVDVARQAGANHRIGPHLYDVVVIPREAVVLPDDPAYPRLPD